MPDSHVRRLPVILMSMLLAGAPLLLQARTPPQAAGNVALEPMLAGEFALQAGKLDEAAKYYLEAARKSGDVGLAERAARIALLANDDHTANQALALWKRGAEPSLALSATEATLALRGRHAGTAARSLEALLRDPDPRGWRYALIALSAGGKNTAATAGVLQTLRDRGALPKDMNAQLAFAGLAQRLQQQSLVDALVQDIVAAHPDEPRVQLLQASLAREAGDLDGARKQLDALRNRIDEIPQARLPLAGEYEALGDAATSAAVLAGGPQNTQTRALRAAMLSRAKDDPGLEKLYAEMQADNAVPDQRHRLLLGQVAETLKKYDEALQWYDSVAGGNLRDIARLRRASTLHAMGRKDEGFAALRALQNDEDAEGEVVRDAYLAEAELHREDGDEKGEFDAYARGLAAMPDELAILYTRALAWERVDQIDRAEADLRKLLVIEPDNVAALNALGYTLADRTTRYREALELIDRARVAEPGNAAIIDSHGWVLYRLGRNEEALVQLERAFALNKDAEVAAHVAEVLWVMGRKDEARKWFDEARRIDPDHRALKRALEKTGAGP
ncbi:MAG: tetratricopeptide repeat protein [Xanthomonadaceae bacterium]|nr:tetratricopeptide repeat protein [Xanthomonadaceae bacterium]